MESLGPALQTLGARRAETFVRGRGCAGPAAVRTASPCPVAAAVSSLAYRLGVA